MGIEIKPKGLTKAHLDRSNIGQDYWEADFSNFKGPENALQITVKYLKSLEEMKDKGIGILYIGPNGPGKTTLAMIVMKYLARANWNVYVTNLGEVIETIQASWGSSLPEGKERAETLGSILKSAEFLLIDDVGKEHRGGSGFVRTVFDNLIRHRVQHRLPTFLTSNFTKSELEGTYGESVLSLLEGKLLPVVVNGPDHRRTELKSDIKGLLT